MEYKYCNNDNFEDYASGRVLYSAEGVPISEKPFIVLFDRPSNKGNLGTMIRSCDALGADMLIITGHVLPFLLFKNVDGKILVKRKEFSMNPRHRG